MLKNILTVIICAISMVSFAQQDTEIMIGDTLYFSSCDGESFKYIDLYVKTRFEDSIAPNYDTLTSWPFYNAYYGSGDFDISRLPCSYSHKYGIVKHIMNVESDDGSHQTIVLVMIKKGSSVAYIIEDAFIHEEILLAAKK